MSALLPRLEGVYRLQPTNNKNSIFGGLPCRCRIGHYGRI
jgi:hypothetical protein